MTQTHEEEILGKAYDARLMGRLLRYARPYWAQFALAGGLLCAITLLEQAGPAIVKVAIDRFLSKGRSQGLLSWAALYLACTLGAFGLQAWQSIQTAFLGQTILLDLRMQIFSHLLAQGLRFFDKNPVGRLMTRVIYDVETLDDFFSQGVVAVFNDFFTLASVTALLLWFDWRLGLAALAVLPLLSWATAAYRRFARQNYRQVRTRLARINAFLGENLSGMATIQAFLREGVNAGKMDALNAEYRDLLLRQIKINAFFLPLAEILSALAVFLVLTYGGWRLHTAGLSVGVIVASAMYVTHFFQPLRDLSDKYNVLQSSMASAERIFSLLDRTPEVLDPPSPRPLPRLQGRVAFEGVWFAYEGEDWVLKDLSFGLAPGERVAVVGPTGAGKTSLVSVLMRFYPYQKGRVSLDGVPLEELSRGDFRRQVSLVLQDPFLFSGSVLENVRLSNPRIPPSRVEEACRQVAADEFIRDLPGGYSSEIGERGGLLSVGQKQLLAFARALVFDPRLLILDEATANVDTATEERVQKALQTLLKGRSSITIAHRLSTVTGADRILVLQGGRLTQQGDHRSLMRQGGLYRSLVELQFKQVERA